MPILALTLPLEIVESLIATCDRLGIQHLKPKDKEALETARREVEQVKGDIGEE